MIAKIIFFILLTAWSTSGIEGHGMVIDPVNRASRWRFNLSAPTNYEDSGLWCGGFQVQYEINGGRCGMCGDDFRQTLPRRHELGGPFGEGVIVKKYSAGAAIEVQVQITVNHMGYFYFDLCNLDEWRIEDERCFQRLQIGGGAYRGRWVLPSTESKVYSVPLQLPAGVSCKACVLRWTYVAGIWVYYLVDEHLYFFKRNF